jgi:hypothetical protein
VVEEGDGDLMGEGVNISRGCTRSPSLEGFASRTRPIGSSGVLPNSRDLAMIDANFAASDEVATDNPFGSIRRGADVPQKMYEAVFNGPVDVHVEFWDYTIDRVGDVFWAVGHERGTIATATP